MAVVYMKACLFFQVLPVRKLLNSDRMRIVTVLEENKSDMLCLNLVALGKFKPVIIALTKPRGDTLL